MFSWNGVKTCLWVLMGNLNSLPYGKKRIKIWLSENLTLGEKKGWPWTPGLGWVKKKGFFWVVSGFILGMIPLLVSAGTTRDETWPRCPALNFHSLSLSEFTFFPHQTIPRVKGFFFFVVCSHSRPRCLGSLEFFTGNNLRENSL